MLLIYRKLAKTLPLCHYIWRFVFEAGNGNGDARQSSSSTASTSSKVRLSVVTVIVPDIVVYHSSLAFFLHRFRLPSSLSQCLRFCRSGLGLLRFTFSLFFCLVKHETNYAKLRPTKTTGYNNNCTENDASAFDLT